jgi:hypothetical protein
MHTLRDGCEAPIQPKIENDDRKHPRYSEYLRYRAAMSAQLVSCPSFKNWLLRNSN